MCVHFVSLTSQFPQAEVGSHQPWGAPSRPAAPVGRTPEWAGVEGTQGFRDVPAWCVWLGQVARVGVAALRREEERETHPAPVRCCGLWGWREGRPAVPRPAFWRGLPGGGNQHQAREANSAPGRGSCGSAPCPDLCWSAESELWGGWGAFNHQSAHCPAPAAPAAPEAGRYPETCCHLRSAGLSATKPPSPDPRQAPRSAGWGGGSDTGPRTHSPGARAPGAQWPPQALSSGQSSAAHFP